MNSDQFEGKWKQIKGSVRSEWSKLTNDDVSQVEGKFEKLVGKVQERYGIAKNEAASKVNAFLDSFEEKYCSSSKESDAAV